jgi:hypothetical protein
MFFVGVFMAAGVIFFIATRLAALRRQDVVVSSITHLETSSLKLSTASSAFDISHSAVYQSNKYGFGFEYPNGWRLATTTTDVFSLNPPLAHQPRINFLPIGAKVSIQCPVGAGVIKCSNLRSRTGVEYAREVSVGPSTLHLDKEQVLSAFFAPPIGDTDLRIQTFLTDEHGNPQTGASNTFEVFDQLISTLVF